MNKSQDATRTNKSPKKAPVDPRSLRSSFDWQSQSHVVVTPRGGQKRDDGQLIQPIPALTCLRHVRRGSPGLDAKLKRVKSRTGVQYSVGLVTGTDTHMGGHKLPCAAFYLGALFCTLQVSNSFYYFYMNSGDFRLGLLFYPLLTLVGGFASVIHASLFVGFV